MRRAALLPAVLLLGACAGSPRRVEVVTPAAPAGGPRVLAVVAHPDDETTFAATLFRAATHAGAVCDVVVITNGEGGYKYATLAERLYGLPLTDEAVGRRSLPGIRRGEMLAAASVLAVHAVHFLDQCDLRYTQDVGEVLGPEARLWDLDLLRGYLADLLAAGDYDLLLTLAPTPETHAHHQAAGELAIEAALRLAPERRPVLLAATSGAEPGAPAPATNGRAATELLADAPSFAFDRSRRFGLNDELDYRIVVNWAIAEHRSQGTVQQAVYGGPCERFYLYAANGEGAEARAAAFFEALGGERCEHGALPAQADAALR
jgi:LmbE family N-acetylglucosaminyl deacetylase